jgi:hypothetical protein
VGLCAVIKGHPHLEQLDLSFNAQVSDVHRGDLVKYCRNLHMVDLNSCDDITDACVLALIRGCPHLTSIDTGCCYQLKEETRQLPKERFAAG